LGGKGGVEGGGGGGSADGRPEISGGDGVRRYSRGKKGKTKNRSTKVRSFGRNDGLLTTEIGEEKS